MSPDKATDVADRVSAAIGTARSAAGEVGDLVRARGGSPGLAALGFATVAVLVPAATGIALAKTLGRGLLGAIAGLGAGLVMNVVHTVFSKLDEQNGERTEGGGEQPATVKAAEGVVGPIEDEKKPFYGSAAHFAMAGVTGAIYGITDGALPIVGFGRGLGYGAAVWAVADELMVPALGLGPKEAPPKTHVRGLIAHLVYGLALDGMFRTGRRVFA
jgi:hypothetical protein